MTSTRVSFLPRELAAANDAATAQQPLFAWLDYTKIVGASPTLKDFCDLVGDPELENEIIRLETYLYTAESDRQWSGEKLSIAVQHARKNLQKQSSSRPQPRLPDLNPGR